MIKINPNSNRKWSIRLFSMGGEAKIISRSLPLNSFTSIIYTNLVLVRRAFKQYIIAALTVFFNCDCTSPCNRTVSAIPVHTNGLLMSI